VLSEGLSAIKRVAAKVRREKVLRFGVPFFDPGEVSAYRQLSTEPGAARGGTPLAFHPRCLDGKAVFCRPGTRDKSSLEDLLAHQVYLPPAEVREPKVIIDLGANVGYTLSHFAHLYPNARIIGLELDRDNFAMAQQNIGWCAHRVALINAAIWSSDGIVKFSGPGEDAFHVDAALSAAQAPRSAERTARSISMPSLLAQHGIDFVDYIKMDIEGGEAELLLNADCSWLKRVGSMKIELHHVPYDKFHQVLTGHGFRCHGDRRHWACIVATRVQ
jgi:FkbM family methyltransferase